MAGIRQIARDYKDEIMDGIAWVAIWKTGRAWNARSFWLDDKDRIERDEICDARRIVAEDPGAIFINEYECAHMGEGTLEDIVAGIRFHYGNGYNKLASWLDEGNENSISEELLLEKNHLTELEKEELLLQGASAGNQLSIDCIAQHLKVFHEQSFFDRTADFGEPCSACPHVMKECRLDWLTRMKPLFDRTDIQIRLDYPELSDIKDSHGEVPDKRLLEYFKRLTQTEKDAVVGRAAELCQDKAVAIYLPLDKREFLESEFGSRMVSVIVEWDQALGVTDRETNPEVQKKLPQCLAQWEICQMVMRQFYGIEYHFTRTDEYFGICTEDGSDWLMKVDRKPESLFKYEKAINRYGIPDQIYLDEGEMGSKNQIRDLIVSDAAEIDEYYEGIINSKLPARTGMEKAIQGLTLKDAGVVLVMIGMEHPASRVVYKYLVDQKLKQYDRSRSYLLNRWRHT